MKLGFHRGLWSEDAGLQLYTTLTTSKYDIIQKGTALFSKCLMSLSLVLLSLTNMDMLTVTTVSTVRPAHDMNVMIVHSAELQSHTLTHSNMSLTQSYTAHTLITLSKITKLLTTT